MPSRGVGSFHSAQNWACKGGTVVSHDHHSASNPTAARRQHPARGNRWATGAERVKGGGNMLELRVPIGLLSSFLTSLKGEGFPRQPRPSTGQCETQDTIPFLSRLLLVRAVHLR
jgi:hypothetical protein